MGRYQTLVYRARSSFEMADGRTLACEYTFWHCADDGDSSEPEFTLEGEPVELADLPKGLDVIAARLLDDPRARVERVEDEPAWGDD